MSAKRQELPQRSSPEFRDADAVERTEAQDLVGWDPYAVWRTRVLMPRIRVEEGQVQREARYTTAGLPPNGLRGVDAEDARATRVQAAASSHPPIVTPRRRPRSLFAALTRVLYAGCARCRRLIE